MASILRPMTRADKPVIMRILQDIPEFKPSEVFIAEEVIDSYLGDPASSGYSVLVAELGADVIGYICYGPTPMTEGTWDIYWMAVAPERQGQGNGGVLLKAAEENIRGVGGRQALIETSSKPTYAKTREFHIRHGYEIIARVPDFYTLGDDKLILQKKLS